MWTAREGTEEHENNFRFGEFFHLKPEVRLEKGFDKTRALMIFLFCISLRLERRDRETGMGSRGEEIR